MIQFDEMLMKHIQPLIELGSEPVSFPFTLVTITCLSLLVERENEIDTFAQSTPARHTRDTLLESMTELGINAEQ